MAAMTLTPEQAAFLELAQQLRKTGAVKVEQTEHGYAAVWATVPVPEKTERPEPVERPKRKPKDPPKVGTPEEEALKQLREELA